MNNSTGFKRAFEPGPNGTSSTRAGRRCVVSDELFRGHRELRILHADQEYRLFVTSKGKLILTK